MITSIHKQIIAMTGYYACGAFIFPLFIDCYRKNFPIWCSNIQKVALYKNFITELYLVVIHMTLSEKTATWKSKSFCKHVENDYSTLTEHLNFFHNV